MKDKANYISPETFETIINTIPELKIRKWKDWDVEMLFKILYNCALRPMEGIRLKKEDIDLENREIYLWQTKTTSEDYAVIPTSFIDELQLWLNTKKYVVNPGERLLPKLTYITFYFWLKRLGKMCDVPAWTTSQEKSHEKTVGHGFRKSVGKDMLDGRFGNAAKDIPIVQKHLRHKTSGMTVDYYLKVGSEPVKEVL